ncbi:MAG: hypothetical protein KIT14_17725 [bacterium]|nr:hypothetical protein [bacterium]
MKGLRLLVGAAALGASLGVVSPAQAEFLEDAGWGSLTVLSNVLYMPAKVGYALFGGLTGGAAYGLTGGDYDTAQNVWDPALSGTYVLTPGMLRGEQPIQFAGPVTPGTSSTSASYAPLAEAPPDPPAHQQSAGGFSDEAIGGGM